MPEGDLRRRSRARSTTSVAVARPRGARASRTGGVSSKPSSSRKPSASTARVGPGSERAASARRAVCSSSASMPATTVSRPCAAASSSMRVIPRLQAASCASRSPSVEAGSRTLAAISSYSARTRRPSSTSLMAGKISPSWNSSVHCALSVPGKRPPMSMWWAIEPGPRDERAAGEQRREDLQVGRVRAAHVRVVGEDRVAGRARRRPTSRSRASSANCIRPSCAGICSECATIRPSAVEQPAVEVEHLADDRREGRAVLHDRHLLRDVGGSALARISWVTGVRALMPRASRCRTRCVRPRPGRASRPGTATVASSCSTIVRAPITSPGRSASRSRTVHSRPRAVEAHRRLVAAVATAGSLDSQSSSRRAGERAHAAGSRSRVSVTLGV